MMNLKQATNQPSQSGSNPCNRRRGLDRAFIDDLKTGILKPLRDIILADDTLSLNIRTDYVNIYYRGGSLLKISARKGSAGQYEFHFDDKYVMPKLAANLGLPVPALCKAQGIVSAAIDVALWVSNIPALKCTMDLWFGKNPKTERELQQVVERMNNSNPSTDYFICDIEYTNTLCKKELRADLIALHWPSTTTARKCLDVGRLAIIEMKHGDGALSGKSGIAAHIKQLNNSVIDFAELYEEMRGVFNQRVELDLIRCHTDSDKHPKLVSMRTSETNESNRAVLVDYIILLSDHDPAAAFCFES